jgi:hypothetical protein
LHGMSSLAFGVSHTVVVTSSLYLYWMTVYG